MLLKQNYQTHLTYTETDFILNHNTQRRRNLHMGCVTRHNNSICRLCKYTLSSNSIESTVTPARYHPLPVKHFLRLITHCGWFHSIPGPLLIMPTTPNLWIRHGWAVWLYTPTRRCSHRWYPTQHSGVHWGGTSAVLKATHTFWWPECRKDQQRWILHLRKHVSIWIFTRCCGIAARQNFARRKLCR